MIKDLIKDLFRESPLTVSSKGKEKFAKLEDSLMRLDSFVEECKDGVELINNIFETTSDKVTKGMAGQFLLKYYKDTPEKLAKIKSSL